MVIVTRIEPGIDFDVWIGDNRARLGTEAES